MTSPANKVACFYRAPASIIVKGARLEGEESMGKNQHVVGYEGRWAVTAEGAQGPSAVFKTQSEAWEKAKAIARKERTEALLHGKNGLIRARNAYGHDPRRSKG